MKWFLLASVLLLGIGSRSFTAGQVLSEDKIYFTGVDSYLFMWNVKNTVRDYPHLVQHDKYQGFPEGSFVNYAPLFVLVISTAAKLFQYLSASLYIIELTGAIFPVVVGILTVYAVYILGRMFLNETGALLSALFFAVAPAPALNTMFGNPDTNSIEPLLSVVFFILTLRSVNAGRIFPVILGIFLFTAALIWQGAILFTGFLFIFYLVRTVIDTRHNIERNAIWFYKAIVIHIALLLLAVTIGLFGIKTYSMYSMNIYFSSAGLLFFGMSDFLSNRFKRDKAGTGVYAVSALSSFLILSVISYLFAYSYLSGIFRGFYSIFFYKDPLYNFIAEMQPLFVKEGKLSFQFATEGLTIFFWISPLIFYFFIRDKTMDMPKKVFFVIWFIVNLILTLKYLRFSYMFAVNLALLFGYSFNLIKRQKARTVAASISAVLIILTTAPTYASLYRSSAYHPVTRDLFPALEWIKRNTPPDKDYGIISRWDFGYWIVYIAERPAVTVNSGIGIEASAKFLTESDEDRFLELLGKNKVRYIIVSDFIGALPSMAEIAGLDKRYFEFTALPDGSVAPPAAYYSLISTRLFLNDGNSFKEDNKGLGHFRLIYESQNRLPAIGLNKDVRKIKVFEFVKGARLKGRTGTEKEINISLNLVSNQGRPFVYRSKTVSDKNGYFEIVAPYATEDGNYSVKALQYMLTYNNKSKKISITGDQVVNGEEIEVSD